MKTKEKTIYELADLYVAQNKAEELCGIVKSIDSYSEGFPKAKIAKIIKVVLKKLGQIDGALDLSISLCKWLIEWTTGA